MLDGVPPRDDLNPSRPRHRADPMLYRVLDRDLQAEPRDRTGQQFFRDIFGYTKPISHPKRFDRQVGAHRRHLFPQRDVFFRGRVEEAPQQRRQGGDRLFHFVRLLDTQAGNRRQCVKKKMRMQPGLELAELAQAKGSDLPFALQMTLGRLTSFIRVMKHKRQHPAAKSIGRRADKDRAGMWAAHDETPDCVEHLCQQSGAKRPGDQSSYGLPRR